MISIPSQRLPEHAGDLLEDVGYNREQALHRMRYQAPEASCSHYAYTNFGITEAAVAAAKAYGTTWETASEERLYKPLKMNSTSSRYSDFEGRANKALNHVLVNGSWTHKFQRHRMHSRRQECVSSSVK
ncbi:serine hydrolase [Candidatus Obscuribacterales bacterium]|nr:serine hydrolase [Candidatus Obscuribacterales bacterium]